jgi:hypothetical protein
MRYLLLFCLLGSLTAGAQWKNYQIGPKGDTLNRVDMQGKKQGPWVIRVDNLRGERGFEEEGHFRNDLREGLWRRFSLEGDLIALESYRLGYKHGKNTYFNYQGEPVREESWRAIDPSSPYDTVNVYDVNDPSRVVRTEVIRVEPNSYRHGTWRYFDPQYGTVVKTEEYVMDKLKEKPAVVAAGDEDMAPIDVTNGQAAPKKEEKKSLAKPKEVVEFEKKNAGKKSVKVRTGSTGG